MLRRKVRFGTSLQKSLSFSFGKRNIAREARGENFSILRGSSRGQHGYTLTPAPRLRGSSRGQNGYTDGRLYVKNISLTHSVKHIKQTF